MTRLDKILCDASIGSRKECDFLIRKGLVCVNGQIEKCPEKKVDENSEITVSGEKILTHKTIVCIMNKPSGYVTSTDDPNNLTVMSLLPKEYINQKVVPAGRLDKDTEGLLLFTNDGQLIHKLISPKSNIPKTYYVEHDGNITDEMINTATSGIELKDGTKCKSAEIHVIDAGKSTITITEGMYHQVKRMYASLGCRVNYLKRIAIGKINLENLEKSHTRELSEEEIKMLLIK